MARPHDCSYRTEADGLRTELVDTQAQLATVHARVDELERALAAQTKKAIGRTSERRKFTEDTAAARPKNDAAAQVKRAEKRAARSTLPTVPVPHAVPEAERTSCSECGASCFVEVARDVSSEYEWVPGHLVRRVHLRETLRCAACNHFVRAPAPPRMVDNGQYGPGFVARVIVHKCADCVPLHRQVKALARDGLHVAPSTLVDLFRRGAELIEPIYKRMRELVKTSAWVHADETSLKMQKVEKLGFIWTFATPAVIVYCFSPDRSGETPCEVLGDSEGVLVVDGYTGYNAVTVPGKRVRAGCNAHARRKFFEAQDGGGDDAKSILGQFAVVFAVEREAAAADIVGQPRHLEMRRERSRPAMQWIKDWCDKHADDQAPKSPMGAAVRYFRNQWEALTVFLEDARIAPDNNWSERLLRIIALGRNNYLFVGHEEGGDNLAMLCSIIATCDLHGVNPAAYLADIFIRVQAHPAGRIDELLPHRWKQLVAQPAAGP